MVQFLQRIKKQLYLLKQAQNKRGLTERECQMEDAKYAHEDQMPSWLREYIESHGQSCHDGVIKFLEELLNDSEYTRMAYLCHPKVTQVTKLRREGSFCGYRNIQMLISYLLGATEVGPRAFPNGMPTIFDLQDRIEDAWVKGFNARGRIETGGIRGTRKYIGTPESQAQALLLSLNIKCHAQRIKDSVDRSAVQQLLIAVASYFNVKPDDTSNSTRIRCTDLPPVYFQRPGHSLTIVGIEKSMNNETHLLAFNPSRRYPWTTTFIPLSNIKAQATLENYRLRFDTLRRYGEFELL